MYPACQEEFSYSHITNNKLAPVPLIHTDFRLAHSTAGRKGGNESSKNSKELVGLKLAAQISRFLPSTFQVTQCVDLVVHLRFLSCFGRDFFVQTAPLSAVYNNLESVWQSY